MTKGGPKYAAVRDALRASLTRATSGDRLPSEAELCAEFGVSRITVRRAVDDLIREGLLSREQGRGTFVVHPSGPSSFRETFADRVIGFFRQQTTAGNTVTTEVLRNTITRDAAAASALLLPEPSDLIRLDRRRFVNGTLQQVSTTWLQANRFPRVLTNDFSEGSLYEFLETQYGTYLTQNVLVIRLGHADTEVACALGLRLGEAVLAMTSTVFEGDEAPVAHGITSFTPASSEVLVTLRDIGSRDAPQLTGAVTSPVTTPGFEIPS